MVQENKFRMEKQITDDDNIISLIGELDLSKASEFNTNVDPFVQDVGRKLILNLKELTYIDSTGIGVILTIIKTRHALKAPFAVENVPPKVQKLFDLTGLTPFLSAVANTVN
ncbi:MULTISPECIES: STAS domain-containing protein [Paenibacillus]|uniref:STAS domain-containing protein n=1 Tax=Paenibacillus TaxID=44249 RepID=UPI001C300761|nr:STAS domain-containing protein [Paenibacillus sp. GbtcB18]